MHRNDATVFSYLIMREILGLSEAFMQIDIIPAKELDRYIGIKEYEIIDLRDDEEYSQGHIKDACHINYDDEEKLLKLSRDKTYILYCDRGGASMITSRFMLKHGYKVKTVSGGILAYRGVNYVDTRNGLS
ncbi:rhodanese-like domain-containing protein [bacterium C-53]|nr:rhodanese-like domain-containing protein [Lachnospiraceae bacterium]NBI01414.1 rhodanese-like domain-containing protein [Lachnospiraceae bacterium]RKJ12727.1 rhodanese-like domain-containing protein [bacterium C-53]